MCYDGKKKRKENALTNEAEAAIRALQGASENAEEALWRAVVACQGMPFRTATGDERVLFDQTIS